jgi:tRNA-splicing ligase RtcB (3'-phosphate/5'-hydroxy nucleic acid ligase)
MVLPKQIKKVEDYVWEIPKSYKKGMNVPARIIASDKLLNEMDAGVFEQVTNVACLPGIQKYSYCMPDGHWGYGFPIGGVAAFDIEDDGIISPGGVGFDINCGMRVIKTDLKYKDVKGKLNKFIDYLFGTIPSGVGSKGFLNVSPKQFDDVVTLGSKWCLENNYATEDDVKKTESYGCIEQADVSRISQKARSRGIKQLGTLGSGNHFLEVQVVESKNIFDEKIAKKFGIIGDDQVVLMVHCGSRGFGHQVATDYLKVFDRSLSKYNLNVYDRELACAPFVSDEGQDYYKAMACAANMAFANRQMILHRIREGFSKLFGKSSEELGIDLVYDVAHNIAKVEKYKVDNKIKKVALHRKGATRAYGPGQKELIPAYQETGQPVILGGSMETGSCLLVGTDKAMNETFGSTAHGSGRVMSRAKAKKMYQGNEIVKQMQKKGIYVKSASMHGLAEEAGGAYKDINSVVNVLHNYGISKKVVGLRPIANIKG